MSTPADDPRILQILEACYSTIHDGGEPDVDRLCADAAELRPEVERLLRLERELVAAAMQPITRPAAAKMPERIAEFTVLEPIGVGGMSHVYRARQEHLGRDVALKVLRPEAVANETSRLRFAREATITAALDHPHIVPVYAAGEAEGHVFLAMKLLRGRSLDRAARPMAPREVARIGRAAAAALQAAHDVGVVHRDVKPANIVVEDGHAYVVDFGLAAFAWQAGVLTRPDSTPGTLIYLPPELARRRGNGLDPRVDVYGLGATLYEMLAGRPPFDPSNPVRAVHQILHQDPAPLQLKGRDRDLEAIVQRAMDKSPQRRFQTAGEMAEELARYGDGMPIHTRRPGLAQRFLRLCARHPTVSALAGLAAALVAILGIVLVGQRQDREARIRGDLQSVATAIGRGEVARAQSLLAGLDVGPAFRAERDRLTAELDCERRLQLLVAMLQSPTARHDPRVFAGLSRDIAGSPAAIARSPRADAALAITSRLLSDNRLQHRALGEATQLAWPRTAAALTAWTSGGDPEAALRGVGDGSGGPFDHLFAGLALRLAHRSERAVEAELRRAVAQGRDAEAIRYSIAISLEAQGQYRAAYGVLEQLTDSPVYATPASASAARLAAHLDFDAEARRHLQRAVAATAGDALLQSLVLPSELDALLELDDVAGFWQRWNAVRGECAHLPQYWLRGGYAAATTGDGEGDLAKAREYFQQGLQCDPDPTRRGRLEVALLELEWLSSSANDTLEPLPRDADHDQEIARLEKLAEDALAVAARAAAAALDPSIAADALLIAARASRATGDRRRGWLLLERTCREHGDPAGLAMFAFQVGYRVAQVQLDQPDGDADVAAPLGDAAAQALVQGLAVERLAQQGRPVEPQMLAAAKQGTFLCAFHLGDAAVALPLAVSLLKDPELNESISDLCKMAIEWGGVRLDRLSLPEAHLLSLLTEARRALERALANGSLDGQQVIAALDRWRQHPSLASAPDSGQSTWAEFWRDAEPLAQRARHGK